MHRLDAWFSSRGWTPFPFQYETWEGYLRGESGLLHAPTGTGKTLAVWGGPLLEWMESHPEWTASSREHAEKRRGNSKGATANPKPFPEALLTVLWLTPLRALANDTAENLREPIAGLNLPWTVELRTGDTSQAQRKKQKERLPSALITTPESLSILLSRAGSAERFASLRCVIVDEWHELLSSKRGVQAELCLARLRNICPGLRTWGLSATLGNIDQARHVLLGNGEDGKAASGRLVRGEEPKRTEVVTLQPEDVDRFPWAGHLGVRLLPKVIDAIERANSTLIFTNTRSQSEIWFRELVHAKPEWIGEIAVHHGSLDFDLRQRVEVLLREGKLKAVVCTSSLDLGVDFSPVDQVIQIGSPKGIARMMQRAGRSGHQPGAVSRIVGVPTNALELVEFAAARDAVAAREIESRPPVDRPLDVLAQHLVTLGLGDGFEEESMLREARTTHAFAELSDQEWQWTLDFVTRGGEALRAYPQYQKLVLREGKYIVESKQIARLHRMSIGTITADAAVVVKVRGGSTLGTIEESFISRLRPGDKFVFAGRMLALERVRDMTAYVKPAPGKSSAIPRWMGGKSPLSTELANAIRRKLDEARRGEYVDVEMQLVEPLLELQARWSRIPRPDELLIETSSYRGMHHAFVFSFAGRLVHEGLAPLVAHRLSRQGPRTIMATGNDYGFELASPQGFALEEMAWRELLSSANLIDDMLDCLNSTEMARRRFREIARVAGLIFQGFPGTGKTARQLQASSNLFFDVFREFDPGNLLLDQARREVLDRELEIVRLRHTLERLESQELSLVPTKRFTPLAFPLWVEHIRTQRVSSESWMDRVQRMALQLEQAAAKETEGRSRGRARNRVVA